MTVYVIMSMVIQYELWISDSAMVLSISYWNMDCGSTMWSF